MIDATNPVEFLDLDSPDRKDAGNPLADYGLKTIDLGEKASTRVFSGFVPGARVVKALNHLPVNLLPEPAVSGGKRVQFYSGDGQYLSPVSMLGVPARMSALGRGDACGKLQSRCASARPTPPYPAAACCA